MATKIKNEPVFIGNGEERIELKGEELEKFEEMRAVMFAEARLIEAEQTAKREARESAIKKLAEVAGLSKDELNAIL